VSKLDILEKIYTDPTLAKMRGEQFQIENMGSLLGRYGLEISPNQYLRELLENAFEALARRKNWGDEKPQVSIHPEWNAFNQLGVCRFVISDNGIGFPGKETLKKQCKFISSTGNSEKVQLRDGNFGQGGRISTVYWNFHGIIYASWHKGEGWMVRIRINKETGQPELAPFPIELSDGTTDYVTAVPAPDEYKYETIKDNGTTVILMGNTGKEHTYFGPFPDLIKTTAGKGRKHKLTGGIYSMHKFLNHRYHELPVVEVNGQNVKPAVSIFVSTSDLDEWPRTTQDAKQKSKGGKRYTFKRQIHGFDYYQSTAIASGIIEGPGDDPDFTIFWHLHDKKVVDARPNSVLRSLTQIGVLHHHEIYENDFDNQVNLYNLFGIYRRPVQKRVSILIMPRVATDDDPRGVSPDGGRSRLIWNDPATRSSKPPIALWAQTFEDNMPEQIKTALAELSEDDESTGELNKKLKKDLKPYLEHLRRHYYKPADDGDKNIGGNSGTNDTDTGNIESTTNTGGAGGSGDTDTTETTETTNTGGGGGGGGGTTFRLPAADDGGETKVKRVNKKVSLPEVIPLSQEEAEAEGIREDQVGRYVEEKHIILFNTGWTISKEQTLKHASKHRDLPGIYELVSAQVLLCYSTSMIEKILEHYKRKGSDNWPVDTWKAQLSVDALTFACSDRLSADVRINGSLGQRVGKMRREITAKTVKLVKSSKNVGVAAVPKKQK
jgi:hypothetical protein